MHDSFFSWERVLTHLLSFHDLYLYSWYHLVDDFDAFKCYMYLFWPAFGFIKHKSVSIYKNKIHQFFALYCLSFKFLTMSLPLSHKDNVPYFLLLHIACFVYFNTWYHCYTLLSLCFALLQEPAFPKYK